MNVLKLFSVCGGRPSGEHPVLLLQTPSAGSSSDDFRPHFPAGTVSLHCRNQDVKAIASLAVQAHESGKPVAIFSHDIRHFPSLHATMEKRGFDVATVVHYKSFAKLLTGSVPLANKISSLLEFGLSYSGATQPSSKFIEYLSRRDFDKTLQNARDQLASRVGPDDARSMIGVVQRFLSSLLGFDGTANGVYLQPRFGGTMVARSPAGVVRLWERARELGAPTVTYPAQGLQADWCEPCKARLNPAVDAKNQAPELPFLLPLCGDCLSRVRHRITTHSPQLPLLREHAEEDSAGSASLLPAAIPDALEASPIAVTGHLANGLRYVIVPNKRPVDRFYSYMHVDVGSVNEKPREQGMAHMLEHALFLGTEKFPDEDSVHKRMNDLGMAWGADANAQTSFRKTLYTLNAPVSSENVSGALDLLCQMTLHAILPSGNTLASERKAVLSEKTFRDSLGFRQLKAVLRQEFPDSLTSKRLPIGKKDCILSWAVGELEDFYRRWYYPGNMCLFVVGNIDTDETLRQVQEIFGPEPAHYAVRVPRAPPLQPDPANYNTLLLPPSNPGSWGLPQVKNGAIIPCQKALDLPRDPFQKSSLPKPVSPPPMPMESAKALEKPFESFTHPLVSQFELELTYRFPLHSVVTKEDARREFLDSVIREAISWRMQALFERLDRPPFQGLGFSKSVDYDMNSGLCSFHVTARPSRWEEATALMVSELQRLHDYAFDEAEILAATDTIDQHLRNSAESFGQQKSDAVMGTLRSVVALRSVYTDEKQDLEIWNQVKGSFSVAEVAERTACLLGPLLAWDSQAGTSLAASFAVLPQLQESDDLLMLEAQWDDRQLTPAVENQVTFEVQRKADPSPAATTVTETRKRRVFRLPAEEIQRQLELALRSPAPIAWSHRAAPQHLFAAETIASLGDGPKPTLEKTDKKFGITWLSLPNGLRIAYKVTKFHPGHTYLRLAFTGGQNSIDSFRSHIVMALSVLLGSGKGDFSTEELELWRNLHHVRVGAGTSQRKAYIDVNVPSRENGLSNALQFVRLLWDNRTLEESAFRRELVSVLASQDQPDLAGVTNQELMRVVLRGDPRFCSPLPSELRQITVNDLQRTLDSRIASQNTLLVVVGDFDPDELQATTAKWLGTLAPQAGFEPPKENRDFPLEAKPAAMPTLQLQLPSEGEVLTSGASAVPNSAASGAVDPEALARNAFADIPTPSLDGVNICSRAEINDDHPKGFVMMAFPCPNGRGSLKGLSTPPKFSDQPSTQRTAPWTPEALRAHPRYAYRATRILVAVLQDTLRNRIRTDLGLCYSLGVSCSSTDALDSTFGFLSCNAFPDDKLLRLTVAAIVDALSDPLSGITEAKVAAARLPFASRWKTSSTSENHFWLDLLTEDHEDYSEFYDADEFYKAITLQDVVAVGRELLRTDLNNIYVGVGVSRNVAATDSADPEDMELCPAV
eukprot:TRINITY_DN6895_c0_g1_i1.p1 TRINITY_DN6895_c0_g1~~TRINITY_DN6895_c0_g1_i1.p1  ORF type:complete len:1451 (-),score=200.15 TRINITY_DN6895_c0_g1_i1:84-4415(-)